MIKELAFSKDGFEKLIVLSNDELEIGVTTLGATLVSLKLLKTKDQRDVVCGFDSAEGYLNHDKYFGTCAGRVAGRIDKGQFTINDKHYQLACNNNGNALHGGLKGFDRVHYEYEVEDTNEPSVKLTYYAHDGEEGYPANLVLNITYKLVGNILRATYEGESDADTLLNITNHSYFNLDGHDSVSILDHYLAVKADELMMIDEDSCPRGARLKLKDTPFDFSSSKLIRECIEGEHQQLVNANGIDHFFVFNDTSNQIKLENNARNVSLIISSNQVGANIYSANYLDGGDIGKGGVSYPFRNSICLETQHYPNDVNINENPRTILRKGEKYLSTTDFKFIVEE